MERDKNIAQLAPGDEFEGFYLLRAAEVRNTTAGKPFLTMKLADKTGEIDAKVWDYSGPIGHADEGGVVKVRGVVTEYRGAPQVNVGRLRLAADGDEYDPEALVPCAPIDAQEAMAQLRALVESISDEDYRAVSLLLLDRHAERLMTIPAGKSMHHAFRGGLLMHTCSMLRLADFLAALYADTVDRSLLLSGTLLHDIGKEREFTLSPLGLVTEYSLSGQLLGHLVLGAQEVMQAAQELGLPEEKTVLLGHMLVSHHGEPEYGAAVRPACAEAELLSFIDRIDSRMEICRTALEETPVGAFSERLYAMEGRRIYHHEGTDQ